MAGRLRTGALFAGWAVAGAGTLLLFIAYLQRDGPGLHCVRTATSVRCGSSLDPRPWLAAGLVLVAVSVAGTVAAQRR